VTTSAWSARTMLAAVAPVASRRLESAYRDRYADGKAELAYPPERTGIILDGSGSSLARPQFGVFDEGESPLETVSAVDGPT
jgi:hypothetical protein